jgi:hypothetical protein
MVSKIFTFLKILFFGHPVGGQEESKSNEVFSTSNEWPFPSTRPGNEDYLIGELIRGVETEDDHVFYIWGGKKRRHLRTESNKETYQARYIVWWLDGRKFPEGSRGLASTCGETKCIKLAHLAIKVLEVPHGPENRMSAPVVIHRENGNQKDVPVVKAKPHIEQYKGPAKPDIIEGSRSICVSAKIFFSTMDDAKLRAKYLNHPEIRGNGRRIYAYDCPWCVGFHLTKQNPAKNNFKAKGTWKSS